MNMKTIARALFRYFIKGLLVVVPIGAALFLIFWGVRTIDNALNLSGIFLTNTKTGKPLYIPGLGILNVIVIILIVGVLVTRSNAGLTAGLSDSLYLIFSTLRSRTSPMPLSVKIKSSANRFWWK